MKRIIFILLIVASAICSCNKHHEEGEGGFTDIILSQSLVSFGQEGGTVSIESSNVTYILISDILCVDTEKHYNPDGNWTTSLEADGIKAEVDRSESNKINITVTPSANINDWIIFVGYASVTKEIRVKQN